MKAQSLGTIQSESVQIQPLQLRDVFAVYRLERLCFPHDSWPLLDVTLSLILPRILRLKAVKGERLIGFVMAEQDRRSGWIATFGVDPGYRRRGVGSELLGAMEALLDKERVRLCVRVSNAAAIRLYERLGYRSVDTWKRYYRGGEDALVMEKQLGGGRPGSAR